MRQIDGTRMSLLELHILKGLQRTARSRPPTVSSGPYGGPIYKDSRILLSIFENGISTMFGDFGTREDNYMTGMPGDVDVVWVSQPAFVPLERLTAIYPMETRYSERGSLGTEKLLRGIQFETDDLRTAQMLFLMDIYDEVVERISGVLGGNWQGLFRPGETIHGATRVKAGHPHDISIHDGDICKPKPLRDIYDEPRDDYEGEVFGGRAPKPQVMLDLDMDELSDELFNVWAKYFGHYLARTNKEAGESRFGDEGYIRWPTDDEWLAGYLKVLETVSSKIYQIEQRSSGPLPIAGLYHQIGKGLLMDQFDLEGPDDDGRYTRVPVLVDRDRCYLAAQVMFQGMRANPYESEFFKEKCHVYETLGDEQRSDGFAETYTMLEGAKASRDVQDFLRLKGEGRAKKAWKLISKTAELNPDDICIWYLCGLIQLELERAAEALRSFEHCIEIKNDSVLGWFGKGLALEVMGRQEEADHCFYWVG